MQLALPSLVKIEKAPPGVGRIIAEQNASAGFEYLIRQNYMLRARMNISVEPLHNAIAERCPSSSPMSESTHFRDNVMNMPQANLDQRELLRRRRLVGREAVGDTLPALETQSASRPELGFRLRELELENGLIANLPESVRFAESKGDQFVEHPTADTERPRRVRPSGIADKAQARLQISSFRIRRCC